MAKRNGNNREMNWSQFNTKGGFVKTYELLIGWYGPQGWWPLQELENNDAINHTKSGSIYGYHPGDYSYPKTESERFEICVGAVLTQNT